VPVFVRPDGGIITSPFPEKDSPFGLCVRTPFWGPLSGLRSTIGGAISQGSIFLGSGLHGAVAAKHAPAVTAAVKTIFAHTDPEEVAAQWDRVAATLAPSFPKVAAMMAEAKTDVLAFTAFPRAHWQKIWSNNPIERLNKEIKRRADVVEIFPNPAAFLRLATAVVIEAHDEWQVTRRYLSDISMAELRKVIATKQAATEPVAEQLQIA
jgi:hypothetical protein